MIPHGFVKIPKSVLPIAGRDLIKKNLTVFPFSSSSFNPDPDPIRLWSEDETHIGVARGAFWDLVWKRFRPEYSFDFSVGKNSLRKIQNPFPPREGQGEVIDEAVSYLNSIPFGGCIVEMTTGGGKTFTAIEIARRLGMKTLIVVHTSVLMSQWIEEIKKFCPEWSVGVIQGQCVDVDNNDVCVGMLQSLSMKDDYPASLYAEFGTLISDEVHLQGSQEFHKVFTKFYPKYVVGLTGTLKRADRAEGVFIGCTGQIIKAMHKVEVLSPTIYFVDTKFVVTAATTISSFDREKHAILAEMVENHARNQLIIKTVLDAVSKGRSVLVLSERVAHVNLLYRSLAPHLTKMGVSLGMMVGSTPEAQRKKAQEARVIVATVQLLAVGFNNPKLDTLVLATPIQSALYQAVGRILRVLSGKKNPVVVDLYESVSSVSRKLALSRKKKYLMKGWTVKNL